MRMRAREGRPPAAVELRGPASHLKKDREAAAEPRVHAAERLPRKPPNARLAWLFHCRSIVAELADCQRI